MREEHNPARQRRSHEIHALKNDMEERGSGPPSKSPKNQGHYKSKRGLNFTYLGEFAPVQEDRYSRGKKEGMKKKEGGKCSAIFS